MDWALLDPEIASFVRRMQADWASHPPFMTLPLDEARAVAEEVRRPWRAGGPKMAHTTEHHVPTPTGPLRIRVYDPGIGAAAPVLIYLHGGGFTLFSIDTHDRLMREYAAAGGFLVVGVDYPLSPEARFPKALDQLVALVGWLAAKGGEMIGCDRDRIAIGGDSAGANLSLAAALCLRERGDAARLRGLLLNYGAFDSVCSDEAEARYGGPGAVLDSAEMAYYFGNYTGGTLDFEADLHARPIMADYAGLPPAFFVIPECDILSEQSYLVAERMAQAGVVVTSKVYPGATHSFLEAMSVAAVAREAIADGAAWVKARLA
ncbi:alpha/beta hydrolase fold domain-containing protein [Flavisphingomonas formosensis]|uniref:alpha/beta hydrolase fold domain-containing protein n=1 Tax=Flavisphingomonas formosensis TaxID=861534 RepID=UPI0012F8CF8D|nr:alpha/beta hydrolase fold domain-containing protein [Sphingomonas formosensis]